MQIGKLVYTNLMCVKIHTRCMYYILRELARYFQSMYYILDINNAIRIYDY